MYTHKQRGIMIKTFEEEYVILWANEFTIEAFVCSHSVEHLDNDELLELIAWCLSEKEAHKTDRFLIDIFSKLPADFDMRVEQLHSATHTWRVKSALICNP